MKTESHGSNPCTPTRIYFRYNNIIYYPKDLNKKLKQLGITINDIEILDKPPTKEIEFIPTQWKYIFRNKKGETLCSNLSLEELIKNDVGNTDYSQWEIVECNKGN